MKIFLKCSFKSSRGFRIGEYDLKKHSLSYVSEQDPVIRERMSREPAKLLQLQLGRSVVLATDETGALFTGVFGLVEGDYDKYVNAVFIGERPEEATGVFRYFYRNYSESCQNLMKCIYRDPAPRGELEFAVNRKEMKHLMDRAGIEVQPRKLREINGVPVPKTLVMLNAHETRPSDFRVFVTRDSYADYQLGLSEVFSHRPKICYENVKDNLSQVSMVKESWG